MGLVRRGSRPSRPSGIEWLVVGLGNPGREYVDTRHNVGEQAVRDLAARHGERLRPGRDDSVAATMHLDGRRIALAVPLTYMNESGRAVAALTRRHQISDAHRLIIVHDELDLDPGTVRVKSGGGLAGHNGLRSITDSLGTQDYLRVRIGVGKPPSKQAGARYVLAKISARDRPVFDIAIDTAVDAIEMIIGSGFEAAAQQINAR